MLQLKAGMHQPLEKKGSAERGVNEQKTQPEEAGVSSVSCSGKYSLIQDQVRELTCLQQKMQIGRVVSSLLIQKVKNAVKTFEELLSCNNVDHYMEQHFREQLAKGSQLAESLASKFSMDDYTNKKTQTGQVSPNLSILREMHRKHTMMEVLETRQDAASQTQPPILSSSHSTSATHCSLSRTSLLLDEHEEHPAVNVANVSPATPAISATLPSNHLGARSAQPLNPQRAASQLSRTPEPGHHGSSGPWEEEMRTQKINASDDQSSSSSLCWSISKSSGDDLLEKNLVEIQNLRQRLEESVCINDRLRERLEHTLSNADQGKSTTTQSAPEGSLTIPCSYTQNQSSGFDQDIL